MPGTQGGLAAAQRQVISQSVPLTAPYRRVPNFDLDLLANANAAVFACISSYSPAAQIAISLLAASASSGQVHQEQLGVILPPFFFFFCFILFVLFSLWLLVHFFRSCIVPGVCLCFPVWIKRRSCTNLNNQLVQELSCYLCCRTCPATSKQLY
jgi:hypothetical protein